MVDTVMVFTGKGLAQIVAEGGSQAWALDAGRANGCTYLVGTQNRKRAHEDWSNPEAPQGTGFVVARIAGIGPAPNYAGRSIIRISDYAVVDIPNLWDGGRNPVRYTSLAALGIDVSKLTFTQLDLAAPVASVPAAPALDGLTIAQAKAGLAVTFGVDVDAIDITIRG